MYRPGRCTNEEALVRLSLLSRGIPDSEEARVVDLHSHKWSLPPYSFFGQRWRQWLWNGPPFDSTAGDTPKKTGLYTSTYFWSSDLLSIQRQGLGHSTMIITLMNMIDEEIY